MIVTMLLSSSMIANAAGARIAFVAESLSSPFVAGEKFAASSDATTGYWTCGDTSIFSEYSTGPSQNTINVSEFITKKAGITTLSIGSDAVLDIVVLKPIADVPVDTEYTVSGGKGTDHKWSIHSPNKVGGKRDSQRGLATIKSSNDRTATVTVTSVGNIIIDHQYIPDGEKELKTEYFALRGTKGVPKCTIPRTIETVDGQPLEFIPLPQDDTNGVWEWDESQNPLYTTINIGGKTSAFAKFIPNNTTDYDELVTEVKFAIATAVEEESVPEEIKYFSFDKKLGKSKTETIKSEDAKAFYSSQEPVTLGVDGETSWYYSFGSSVYASEVTIAGDVNVILMDGSTAFFSNGIKGNDESSLTIYSTSNGEKQGVFSVMTPNGDNGENNYENDGCATSGDSAKDAADLCALTINGGYVEFLAGFGGNGGLGGNYALENELVSSAGGNGGNGGDALAVKTLTINAGCLKAIGGNGGNGGNGQNVRYGGNAGNGGWGVNIKDGGAFDINVADDYKGTVYIASGKGGAGGKIWDRPDGVTPAAVNTIFNTSNKDLAVFSSDSDMSVNESGAVNGTKLKAKKYENILEHRCLLVNLGSTELKQSEKIVVKENQPDEPEEDKGVSPVIFVVIGVVVVAAVVAFIAIKRRKAAVLALAFITVLLSSNMLALNVGAYSIPEGIEVDNEETLEEITLPRSDDGKWDWDEKKNPLSTKIEIGGKTSAALKFTPNNEDAAKATAEVEFIITAPLEEVTLPKTINYYKWDKNDKSQKKFSVKATNVNVLTSSNESLTIGSANETTWYYACGNVIVSDKVNLVGNVNLILESNSTTTFTNGIVGDSSSSLTVFATSLDDKQGVLVISTPDGANGKHFNESDDYCSTLGQSATDAAHLGSLTINGGKVALRAGNGGFGGNGGKFSIGDGWYIESTGANGGNGGNGLDVTNLTINGGNFSAVGGDGGNGGTCHYGLCGNGGNAGFGISFNKDGNFNVDVADNYSGIIYIAGGIAGNAGSGIGSTDGQDGTPSMATNVSFKAENGLVVYTSNEDITTDEKGKVSGTKLKTATLTEMSAHRVLYACGNPSDKDNHIVNDTASKSGVSPVIFIVIGVVVAAGAVAFVAFRKNKKLDEIVENTEE